MDTDIRVAFTVGLFITAILLWLLLRPKYMVCTDKDGKDISIEYIMNRGHCPPGYSDKQWQETYSCEKNTLKMPYKDDQKRTLQLINPTFGFVPDDKYSCGIDSKKYCVSNYSSKLHADTDAGKDVDLEKDQYVNYFYGDDPCPGTDKYVKFQYRYV